MTVVKSAPGRLPASSLASDSVSQSECYERSNSVIPLMHRKHFICRESVHLVWFSHFNRCICRPHRSVCHRGEFRYSISNAQNRRLQIWCESECGLQTLLPRRLSGSSKTKRRNGALQHERQGTQIELLLVSHRDRAFRTA